MPEAERWQPPGELPRLRLIRTAPIFVYAYGRPMAPEYVEHWTPVRNVTRAQVCATCWEPIEKGGPRKVREGDPTRAWFEFNLGLWRCQPCQSAGGMQT